MRFFSEFRDDKIEDNKKNELSAKPDKKIPVTQRQRERIKEVLSSMKLTRHANHIYRPDLSLRADELEAIGFKNDVFNFKLNQEPEGQALDCDDLNAVGFLDDELELKEPEGQALDCDDLNAIEFSNDEFELQEPEDFALEEESVGFWEIDNMKKRT